MNRKDVAEAYKIETDCKCGFEAHFPRKLITGSRMEIRFSGAQETEIHEVDMKRFDRETSSWGRVMDLLAPAHARDNVRYIRENSLGAFASLIKQEYHAGEEPYDRWRREHALTGREIKRQRQTEFAYRPLISISIPVYNTPLPYLKELLESILGQTYDNWELCLADGSTNDAVQQYLQENYRDTRIRYKRLEKNEGIAGNTNQALAMASGEFIMLTDHDDTLTVNALYEMVKALNEDPDTDIIYTDEDLVDAAGKTYSSPRFKPDFNYEFLRSINYICHIFMVRKSIMEEVGGFRAEYDGAQDYDMILRCCEKTTRIRHIPMVLYHWRAHPDSTAGNPESKMYAVDASVRALKEHYHRLGIEAEVKPTDIFIMLHTIRKVSGCPKISIIIPNKDHIEDLDLCISSIRDRSSYSNYEIIVVENNSTDPETFAYYDRLTAEDARIQVVTWTQEFNYSKINNFGAQYATGDYYILLNNDIEVISPDWMEGMLGYCQEPGTGAVGAKLYYPDDTVQHCGIVIGVGGFGGHILTGSSSKDTGYFGKLKAVQEVSAVTAACMMVKREVFEQVGGFDEDFAVALNDVDLCMKIRDVGEKIILNPWVEMYHYESKSRGFEDTPEKIARFKKEIRRFRNKWKIELEKGDPYYNPNLTLDRGDCSIRRADERFEIIEEIEAEDANERTI
jgi:GT2 family glycosyltransferase